MNNPKLEGSGILDCIPQTGICPHACKGCYYNEGFYRSLDTPLLPSLEEAEGKIVRVNSGNDSNNQRELVIETTIKYKHCFYNTSNPRFDFPHPVIYCCNPKDYYATLVTEVDNLMAVRIKVGPYNVDLCDMIVKWYTDRNTPVILTYRRFMSYNDDIPQGYEKYYYFDKHILNNYYCLEEKWKMKIRQRYHDNSLVFACGVTKFCRDCRNCETLYWRFMGKEDRNESNSG